MSSGRAEGQPGVCALPGHPVGSVHLCLVSSRELEGCGNERHCSRQKKPRRAACLGWSLSNGPSHA